MDEILELARQLGAKIATHERFKEFKEAQKAVEEDEEAQRLTEQLKVQSEKIQQLERDLQPVEPEDKRELKRIQDAIASNAVLKRFARAQADYAELMARVNEAIQSALRG